MDPHLVYSRYGTMPLLLLNSCATEYSTFVAMPFRNRFSYKADDIYKGVMQAAATKANAC